MDQLGVAMSEPEADFDALMAEMGEVQTELDHRNAWDIDSQLEQAMDALRCPPPDALVDVLSGGERRRVALCKLLLQQPDLLLLDEPTNHLDAESVQWLETHLKAYPGAVLAVTHDRYFLDNVAQWILELDRTDPSVQGNYSTGHQEWLQIEVAGMLPKILGGNWRGAVQPEGAAGWNRPGSSLRGVVTGRAQPQARF
jgi:ATPase subunit of ABC transporter with duplicated ATPase domains